jgi:two-component system, cell cycle sensor histidine kinase and response regulator CckA
MCEASIPKRRTILVMDDEDTIRKISTEMLESLGYEVTACSDGTEAINLYKLAKDAGNPFAAVVMDLDVPAGMGGNEAAQHILALDPDARLIVSSGNHGHPAMNDFKSYGFCCVLPKPYNISDLFDVLSGGVDGRHL